MATMEVKMMNITDVERPSIFFFFFFLVRLFAPFFRSFVLGWASVRFNS